MQIRTLVLLFAVLLCGSISAKAQCVAESEFPNLCTVKKIFVDSLGYSDEAERFRYVFMEKLEKEGFTVVDDPSDADGIVRGVVATGTQTFVYATRTQVTAFPKLIARGNLEMFSLDGKKIWSSDFKPGFFKNKDGVKQMANKMGDQVKKDWLKSAGQKK